MWDIINFLNNGIIFYVFVQTYPCLHSVSPSGGKAFLLGCSLGAHKLHTPEAAFLCCAVFRNAVVANQ